MATNCGRRLKSPRAAALWMYIWASESIPLSSEKRIGLALSRTQVRDKVAEM